MKNLFIILIILIVMILALGCTQETVEPEKEEMLCLFKRNPTQTDASCIPNCPPYKSFDKCIEKWEAYKYPGKKGWIVEENCGRCE